MHGRSQMVLNFYSASTLTLSLGGLCTIVHGATQLRVIVAHNKNYAEINS